MTELPQIDAELVRNILVSFIRQEITRAGLTRAVVGLSGGLDSAVSCMLSAEALGPQNVLALMMPHRNSSPDSLDDQVVDQHDRSPRSRSITPPVSPGSGPLCPSAGAGSRGGSAAPILFA